MNSPYKMVNCVFAVGIILAVTHLIIIRYLMDYGLFIWLCWVTTPAPSDELAPSTVSCVSSL